MDDRRNRFGTEQVEEFDRLPVRILGAEDLDEIVRIDRRILGRSRRDYLEVKLREALGDTRIKVSLGVNVDGALAGFLLGRLYYGEFGLPEPTAIIDTLGVDPARRSMGIGLALVRQFRANLAAVGIESIQTQVAWNDWELLRFLDAVGFRPAPKICLEARIEPR